MLIAAGPLFAGCVGDGAAAGPSASSSSPAVDELELPDTAERDDRRAEMAAGADASLAELTDEQERFAEAADTVTEDDTFGRVGQFFNSIEKVDSLVEPVIARYGRIEFQRAFLNEPRCEHVIQPFRIVAPASSDLDDVGA